MLGRVTLGKGARVYLFAGPSFDFNLGAEASVQGQDLFVDLKAIEVAVVFGGGLELGPILVEGRWSEGLTDLQAQVPQVLGHHTRVRGGRPLSRPGRSCCSAA